MSLKVSSLKETSQNVACFEMYALLQNKILKTYFSDKNFYGYHFMFGDIVHNET